MAGIAVLSPTFRVNIDESASHSLRAWVIFPISKAACEGMVVNLRVVGGGPQQGRGNEGLRRYRQE